MRGMLWGTRGLTFYNALRTQEDDWLDNQRGISCIPDGKYKLVRTIYHKHGYETFEVTNVPGRSRILIHPGNTEEDSDGCILVGMRTGYLWVPDEDKPDHPLTRKRAVVESRAAFSLFMREMMGVDEDYLTIQWGPGLP